MDNKENKYDDIKALAKKWMQGSLSAEEEAYFEAWYASFNDEEVYIKESAYHDASDLKEKVYTRLMERIEQDTIHSKPLVAPFPTRRLLRISTAAACLLAVITVGWLLFNKQATEPTETVATVDDDVAPGSNKAVLLLSDGQKIDLSGDYDGIVVGEGIAYEGGATLFSGGVGNEEAVEWYSVMVPYGGQYSVVLPDGSKVWLNSGSTLKYPNKFNMESREVELEGEAYFEITPYSGSDNQIGNKYIPFFVRTKHQLLEVLSTAFNINAYENESAIRTTLLQGSVKVSVVNASGEVSGTSRTLKPTQQAILKENIITVNTVDTDREIAWIKGIFDFDDLGLSNIMRQLERWYDIHVDYASLPDLHFTGSISKDVNLSEVLKMFEIISDVEFGIEGKNLRINKKKL